MTKQLPVAHAGESYETVMVGTLPLSQPMTCVQPNRPVWLSFDCKELKFSGVVQETEDGMYALPLTLIGHDGIKANYVLNLQVKVGAETVELGSAKPVAPAAKQAPAVSAQASATVAAAGSAIVSAPSVVSKSQSVNTRIEVTTQLIEGATSVAGYVRGIPSGSPAFSVSLAIEPFNEPEYLAPLKGGTMATGTQAPVATDGSFEMALANPLPAGGAVDLRLIVPSGVTLASGAIDHLSQDLNAVLPAPTVQITSAPLIGAQSISGIVSPMPSPAIPAIAGASPSFPGNYPQIVVWLHEKAAPDGTWARAALSVGSSTATTAPVTSDGNFTVQLKNKLLPDESIVVEVLPPAGHTFPATVSAFSGVAPLVAQTNLRMLQTTSTLALARPIITSLRSEGGTSLSGVATATASSDAPTVNVAILKLSGERPYASCITVDAIDNPIAEGELIPLSAGTASALYVPTNAQGTFTATLAVALRGGELIQAVQVLPAGTVVSPETTVRCNSSAQKVTSEFDLYRTNITFAAGVLISNSSPTNQSSANFSQANQFFALNLDRAWRLPGVSCQNGSEFGQVTGKAAGPTNLCHHSGVQRPDGWRASPWPGINTYFETRLTSIPVSSNTATNTTATTTSSSSTSSTGTASASSAFLTSQKTVRVSAGAFLPWMLGHGAGPHPSAIFLAPIAKIGFDTIAGAAQSSTVVVPGGGTQTLNYQSAYNFYSFGGRIGAAKLSSSKGRGPFVEDYLDVTLGHYSNLESLICHATSGASNAGSASQCKQDYADLYASGTNVFVTRKRLFRVDLEGLLRIPVPATAIPFYVGMNANIGQHEVGADRLDYGYATPDDIRIFFGTKLDIGKMLSGFKLNVQ